MSTIFLCGDDRPQKEKARNYALEKIPRLKTSLWLPGPECKCIKQAFENGIVDKNSKIILAECSKNSKVINPIKFFIKKHPNCSLWNDNVCNLNLPYKLDYAFLDFLGTFNIKMLLWLSKNLASNMSADGTICFTHTYGWRNNKFLDFFVNILKREKYSDEYQKIKINYRLYDKNIWIPQLLLKCAFNKYNCEFRLPVKYRDSIRSMLLLRLDGFEKLETKTIWPDIDWLQKQFEQQNIHSEQKNQNFSTKFNLKI